MSIDCRDEFGVDHGFRSFSPARYLAEYYSEVRAENSFLLKFFVDAYRDFDTAPQRLLEIGGGPTIYQLISASNAVAEIYFTDYLVANLAEVRNWKGHSRTSFDWSVFFRHALRFEAGTEPTTVQINQRMELLRARIIQTTTCNVLTDRITSPDIPPPDVVSVNFVVESITGCRTVWGRALEHIAAVVPHGRWLVMSGLLGASYWITGSRRYPAVFLELRDVVNALSYSGLDIEMIRSLPAERPRSHPDYQGYDGIFCLKARKQ